MSVLLSCSCFGSSDLSVAAYSQKTENHISPSNLLSQALPPPPSSGCFSPASKSTQEEADATRWGHKHETAMSLTQDGRKSDECLFQKGAQEGRATKRSHRIRLQHRGWGGWRGHFHILHPCWRTSGPQWRAEKRRQTGVCTYTYTHTHIHVRWEFYVHLEKVQIRWVPSFPKSTRTDAGWTWSEPAVVFISPV